MVETGGRLLIFDQTTGERPGAIPRLPMSTTTVPGSRPGAPPARGPRPRRRSWRSTDPETFLAGSAASGNSRLAADLVELAALRAAHGDEQVRAALERAVAFRRWRTDGGRSILAAGAGTAQVCPPGTALVLELPQVPIRPPSDYRVDKLDAIGDVL
ncbi:hypothetical protein [Microbispora sp. NPDC046933]|uniref:hypothetical protein n=1 Tax=Microbispora sp. NPDC046933 TaxID=3155618 RepID=UPI0033CA499B